MLTQRLRHRVTFQRQVQVQDSTSGDVTIDWADVYTDVAAECLTGPGRETVNAGTKDASIALRVTLRFLPDIDQAQRLVWNTQAFNIETIDHDKTGVRETRLTCTTGLTDGR